MVSVETCVGKDCPKVFFYYPAYGHPVERQYPNGTKKTHIYSRRVVAGIFQGSKLFLAEAICFSGTKKQSADQFNKRTGRLIAEGRCWKAINTNPEVASHIIEVPEGTELLGKFFVQEVEKRYPKHVKAGKAAPKTEEPAQA